MEYILSCIYNIQWHKYDTLNSNSSNCFTMMSTFYIYYLSYLVILKGVCCVLAWNEIDVVSLSLISLAINSSFTIKSKICQTVIRILFQQGNKATDMYRLFRYSDWMFFQIS